MQEQNFYNPQPSRTMFAKRLSNRNLAWLSVVLHSLIFLMAGLLVFVYLRHSAQGVAYQAFPAFGENMRRGGEFPRQVFTENVGSLRPLLAPFLIVFFAWGLGLALHFLAVFVLTAPNRAGEKSRVSFAQRPPYPFYPPSPYPPYQYMQVQPYPFEQPYPPGTTSLDKTPYTESGWPEPRPNSQEPGEEK